MLARAICVVLIGAAGLAVPTLDLFRSGCTGDQCTGAIAVVASAVPLSPAVLLFGTALVGMGLLARRRS
jgi:hypothetical protein